jgi:anti-anti-sigma regulatory factor
VDFQFDCQENCLIIKLYGTAGANERLLSRKALIKKLENSPRRVIVDLSGLKEDENPYILGILGTMKKEVETLGGSIRLCSLRPKLFHYFQERRIDGIFDMYRTMDQAKRSFEESNYE